VSALVDRPAKLPLGAAMQARDLATVLDAFAPDAVLHSPLTGRLTFQGREQIRAVMQVVLDVYEDLHYTDELQSGDSWVLVGKARVAGNELEMVDHMRLDEHGKIRELTVFFRPLPATAVAMRLLGTGLGRRQGRVRAQLISLLTRPLGFMTRVGDRVGVRLVGPIS
jgi:SnoaL-like domain